MDCFLCLSVWVAAPVALLVSSRRARPLVAWLGLSGGACLLERATATPTITPLPNDLEGGV